MYVYRLSVWLKSIALCPMRFVAGALARLASPFFENLYLGAFQTYKHPQAPAPLRQKCIFYNNILHF